MLFITKNVLEVAHLNCDTFGGLLGSYLRSILQIIMFFQSEFIIITLVHNLVRIILLLCNLFCKCNFRYFQFTFLFVICNFIIKQESISGRFKSYFVTVSMKTIILSVLFCSSLRELYMMFILFIYLSQFIYHCQILF